MGDSEEVPCGACCELVDRTCEWYFCDSCGDALHHPASCNDVWHPHENLHFCNKKCASAVLKSQRVVFVLQQRMPPAPSAGPALSTACWARASLLDEMLQEAQATGARNAAARAAADADACRQQRRVS